MNYSTSVRVIGAGPTGSLLAIALAKTGTHVTIVDTQNPSDLIKRSRAYALNHSSLELFKKIGIWDEISSSSNPFKKLFLQDQSSNTSINLTNEVFGNIEYPDNYIGWILDHKSLMMILLREISNSSNITSYLGADFDNIKDDNDFIIVADGNFSKTRENLGLKSFRTSYKQACLTAMVVMRGSEPDIAYEIFRPEGPMAILPMGNQLFQVVWSAPLSRCIYRSSLNDSLFLDKLAAVLPAELQPDCLIDSPTYFPVSLSVVSQLTKGKYILVGETAHSCHPVGGQGLNLCWRDVHELMDLFRRVNQNQLKKSSLPKLYSKNRHLDIILLLSITDILVKVFSNKNKILMLTRRLLLIIIRNSKPLQRLTMILMMKGPMKIFSKYN